MTDPDVPLLADLDAGLLDPARAREVERAAQADPRSAAVLHALAATRADLAAVPAPVAPPELVAGWLAALDRPDLGTPHPGSPDASDAGDDAGPVRGPGSDSDPALRDPNPAGVAESGPLVDGRAPDRPVGEPRTTPSSADRVPPDPPTGPARPPARGSGTGRPGGRRRTPATRPVRGAPRGHRWVLVGAAAALVVGVLVLRPTGPPDVSRVELAAVARSTVGTTDLGEFADPARRDGCLIAAGHAGAELFGGRRVRWEGTPGVLLVVSTGELGVFRALVVTGECQVLADEVVGS